MDFAFNETQRMLVEGAERLMKSRGTVEHWRARRDLPDGLDVDAWQQFSELGWLALPIPEEAGGLAGSMEDVAFLMIALGKGLSTEPYVSSAVLCAHIIGHGMTNCGDTCRHRRGRIARRPRAHGNRRSLRGSNAAKHQCTRHGEWFCSQWHQNPVDGCALC
jgi:alkylation response protein AidB-like acyl-CoA dehydrogenase